MLMMRKNKDKLVPPAGLNPDDQLITIEQVAAWAGVAVDTIRREREAGRMPPAKKIGRALRWRRGDIRKWIDTL